MFQHKTRGNASPQGKQKVYFTCHPDDFDRYFAKISDQLLRFENCAVWYLEPGEDYQDMATELDGMKLFVIPVTTKLLTTPNRTMERDVPFALERHIPILPLMQEGGLSELFNKGFGSLHYLDENARDDTATPYEEKLKRYLSSVIVGDELAEKVKAAFDAYIFLSYRKKDRKYAQELMRLIHKNDFCRDIAIWYDEFLTPGENFNSAIEGALKKSRLFALVVTPNLVNEKNYVQSTEYPMARDGKKRVLPAEMVGTDRERLSVLYPDIPDCVDARNEMQLSETLLDALKSIARAENDGEPQHNFFIGLAYLNGIDVEVDTERAKALITASAEAGLPEAVEKLVAMYQSGDGVERDYREAAEWQRRLVELWREIYARSGSQQDGQKLIYALWNLGDAFYSIRSLSEAEAAYREMEETASRLSLRRELLVSYGKLGDLLKAEGKLPEAETYYEKALGLSEELAKETGTVEARRDLSVSYERLGDLLKAEGKLLEAETYYQKDLELSEELSVETGTVEARRDLSVSYEKLGNILKAKGKLPEAETYYEKALGLSEELAKETGTVEARRDLSVSYNKLGDLLTAEGKLREAETYYEKELGLSEELAKETGTVEARRDLSVSYNKLGDILTAEGKLAEAETYYEKALGLREELARETGTVEARRDLSVSYNKLGDILTAEGKLAEAETYYEKELGLSEELAKETGTVEARRDLSVSYNKLGDLLTAEGKLREAETYYEKALGLREELAKETGTVEAQRDLSVSYALLGDIREAEGKLREAETYYQKTLRLMEELSVETGTVEARRDLSVSYNKLGDILTAEGKLREAETYYEKALGLSEELFEETGTVEARRDLWVSYENLGDLLKAQGKLAEAETYYQKGLELSEELSVETGTVEAYDDLGVSYYQCAMIKNPPDTVLLEQAYRIYEELARQCPGVVSYIKRRDILQGILAEKRE